MSALENAFTRAAGIEVPLICGAMYPCSNPELVAAVSEAGGLGIIQPISLTYVHGHDFREGLRYIRRLTEKPVGMNVILESSSKVYLDRMRRYVDASLEEGVRFASPINGDRLLLTPEESMRIQLALDSDIAMVFDECTPYAVDGRRTTEDEAAASLEPVWRHDLDLYFRRSTRNESPRNAQCSTWCVRLPTSSKRLSSIIKSRASISSIPPSICRSPTRGQSAKSSSTARFRAISP